jgi:hypothetical protein
MFSPFTSALTTTISGGFAAQCASISSQAAGYFITSSMLQSSLAGDAMITAERCAGAPSTGSANRLTATYPAGEPVIVLLDTAEQQPVLLVVQRTGAVCSSVDLARLVLSEIAHLQQCGVYAAQTASRLVIVSLDDRCTSTAHKAGPVCTGSRLLVPYLCLLPHCGLC